MISLINYSACVRPITLAGLIAVSVAGCQTSGNSVKPLLGGSGEAAPNVGNATVQETTAWGKKWEANKGDPTLTLEYVARLRAINSDARALAVLDEAAGPAPSCEHRSEEPGHDEEQRDPPAVDPPEQRIEADVLVLLGDRPEQPAHRRDHVRDRRVQHDA